MIFRVMTVFFSGVGAASLAKLTFMVGGVEEEFNAAQELLTCMGANVVYCGQVGSGQVNTHKHECPLACNQLKVMVSSMELQNPLSHRDSRKKKHYLSQDRLSLVHSHCQ